MNLILYSNLIFNFAHTHNNKIYQYISNIKGHDNFPTQMFHNDQQACNDQEKAQLFNKYFTVFSSDITTPVSESTSTSTLQDIEITELLSSLDVNKTPSIDNISSIVYKCCALSLLKPICHLFAVSLSSGNIPSQWRTH